MHFFCCEHQSSGTELFSIASKKKFHNWFPSTTSHYWLKNSGHFFVQSSSQAYPALSSQLHVISSSFNWFTVLSLWLAVTRFWFGFMTLNWKPLQGLLSCDTQDSKRTCVPEIVCSRNLTVLTLTSVVCFFPTSDKVGFNRQYNTLWSSETSESRKIARMLASSQGEYELVWIHISLRRVTYTTHFAATNRYFLGGRGHWKMHSNRIFQSLRKSIASAIFPWSPKARKLY